MNEKNRREKRVTRKAVLQNIIICLISMIISFIVVKYIIEYVTQGQINILGHEKEEKMSLIIMLFAIVTLNIFFCICMLDISIEEAKRKLYKKMAQELLSKDTYVKVYPQKGHLNLPKFFEEQISHYYAIINKDGKIDIVVTLKEYYDGDDYHLLEEIPKESFVNSYEVTDERQRNKKVELN